jgi:hypothetical protein
MLNKTLVILLTLIYVKKYIILIINFMRKLILTIALFSCVCVSIAQPITFETLAKKYFNPDVLQMRFSELDGYDIWVMDPSQDAMESDIMKRALPVCDSIESYTGFLGNYVIQHSLFSLLKNLKALYLRYPSYDKSTIEPYNIPSKLQSLVYEDTKLPIPFDLKQFVGSLKILDISIEKKVSTPFYFNFSSFDSLRYLSFTMKSCKSYYYTFIFPPNLYCLEWTVPPKYKYRDISIPLTVEILFLDMKNNTYPSMLYKLPNLKFLSNTNYISPGRISLPKELITVSSLKTLQVKYLKKEDIEIISQMENIDSLYVEDAKKKLPPNIYKLKNLKYIEIHSYSVDPRIITGKIKTILPEVTVHYRFVGGKKSYSLHPPFSKKYPKHKRGTIYG